MTCSCTDFLTIDRTNVYSEATMIVSTGHKSTLSSYLNYGYNDKNCIIGNLKHIAETMLSANNINYVFRLDTLGLVSHHHTLLSRGPLQSEVAFVGPERFS